VFGQIGNKQSVHVTSQTLLGITCVCDFNVLNSMLNNAQNKKIYVIFAVKLIFLRTFSAIFLGRICSMILSEFKSGP
jgi:hypothetical protein